MGCSLLWRTNHGQQFEELLYREGETPLPPYIERPVEGADDERYQTVYARHPGAVAAPTAGLHFNEHLFENLAAKGVRLAKLAFARRGRYLFAHEI